MVAGRARQAQGWAAAGLQPAGADRHLVRAADRLPLGVVSPGTGLRIGHDLLATLARLASGRGVEKIWRVLLNELGLANEIDCRKWDRQLLGASAFWGAQTGPNPTDRGKNGSKRHVACDGQGTPLAITHTGANVHDSQAAIPLIDAIPLIKRPGGGRCKRPNTAFADRAYDAEDKIRVAFGHARFIIIKSIQTGNGPMVHLLDLLLLTRWDKLSLPLLFLVSGISFCSAPRRVSLPIGSDSLGWGLVRPERILSAVRSTNRSAGDRDSDGREQATRAAPVRSRHAGIDAPSVRVVSYAPNHQSSKCYEGAGSYQADCERSEYVSMPSC